jgi:hypothetical protein
MKYEIKFINVVTITCLLTLFVCLYSYYSANKEYILRSVQNDRGRNEGSTPRSFILPATPAVAREQERKREIVKKHDQITRCLFALEKNGFFAFDQINDIFDVNVTIAIIEYQSINKLNVTGDFDLDTKESLLCK